MSKSTARELLSAHGVPLGEDFHRLPSSVVDGIVAAAEAYGYRKPRNANGSKARYFYAFANRGQR